MEPLDRHARAMDEFDRRLREVGDDRWDDPTPCRDWSVRELVNHVVVEQLRTPELLSGASLEDVAARVRGDQLGGDPVGAWERASAAARAAVVAPGALELEIRSADGPISARDHVERLALDLAVHAWDLGRAIGGDERLDEELVAHLFEHARRTQDERAASGRFGPPRATAPTADTQTRLLALLGRGR